MFPYRLKQLRENAGLTQDELAKKLNLTQSTIAYYESGRKMPTLENAIIIAKLFDISFDYLLGLSNDRKTIKQSKEITSTTDKLSEEKHNLSPENQEEVKKYIELLKLREKDSLNDDNKKR
ncbi:helix-turn-helix domain-containing protein [Xylanivirga thermophila]|uniref:helix-turn-helix domain-containing protein n=1 Tax=Xylanivirga thermophila TaxID=2496273 RepID=UPI00101BCC3A|nr:helix-turn-helix transcriptional regulator [Xylanivirga thermophila]